MVKPRSDTSRETTPKQFPEVVPSQYSDAVGTGWIVESMMQIQKSIGELSSTVNHLKQSVDSQTTKLDRISHVVFAAGVVLAILLAVGGFFLNKIWDGIFALIAKMPPLPPVH